jgi:PelA/Pel-15E family pectate lyase
MRTTFLALAVVAVSLASGRPGAASPPSPSAAAGNPPSMRITLVGDSTVTDDSGWGRGFKARWSDQVLVWNMARNGRSSKSYIDEGHWRDALAKPADYVLIQFGHNDQPGKGPTRETRPDTTFREFLGRYVDEARAAGMKPVLVTSLTRRIFTAEGRIASNLGTYADATAAVARSKGVPLIDLHALSIRELDRVGPERSGWLGVMKPDFTYDSTHLSEYGSEVFGSIVAEEFVRLIPTLAPRLRPTSIRWEECLTQTPAWYAGDEAARIGNNVVLYQRSSGGWPKDLDMARVLDEAERAKVQADKGQTDSTIDNDATTTQLRFLARVYAATGETRWREACLVGLDYLLAAQYPNGGWPQFFPLRNGHARHIAFNDNAMANVLFLLNDVVVSDPVAAPSVPAPFGFVDHARRVRAAAAIQRGTALILATQVRVNGQLTAWCAQHDEVTLEPAPARTFEPVSLSAKESVALTEFLMTRPTPTPSLIAAVDAAVTWLRDVRLTGLRLESRVDVSWVKAWDRVLVADPAASPLWARFYEIGTNRPIFADRDRVVKYRVDEIGYERRTGYAWYGTWPADLVGKHYEAWRLSKGSGAITNRSS